MHQCCVIGCKNEGRHSFPKETMIRKLWEAAIRRKDFIAKTHRICSAHFKTEDFIEVGRFTGLYNTRHILKKVIVPSIFQWTETKYIKSNQRRERAKVSGAKRKLNFVHIEKLDDLAAFTSVTTATSSSSEMAGLDGGVGHIEEVEFMLKNDDLAALPNVTTAATCNTSSESEMAGLDGGVDHVEEVVTQENSLNNPQLQNYIPGFSDRATQKNCQFYTIESFRNDDRGINFYTGFESFNKFMFVFNTLCPEAHSLTYIRSQVLGLSVEDQFFLTLMKLRRNKEDYELGVCSGILLYFVSYL